MGNRLGEAVLTSTHNLCFEQKNNNVYPCKSQFFYIKVGFKEGGGSKLYRLVFMMWPFGGSLRGLFSCCHVRCLIAVLSGSCLS